MPEIGTSGSMSEDEKRSDATWPQRPRSSSTLPERHSVRRTKFDAIGAKPTSRRRCHFREERLFGLSDK